MSKQGLYELFMDELQDMYSAENQIIGSLPKLINLSSSPELKKALSDHLEETELQVKRIEEIFSILEETATENTCEAMEGLLEEAEEITEGKQKSSVLDAAIIGAAQKVEHYEIASYGTLKSFAKHLDLNDQVINLIQETLYEEGDADKKLTKIAEGSLFRSGVNEAAAEYANKKTTP